jgi:hypothetical protein
MMKATAAKTLLREDDLPAIIIFLMLEKQSAKLMLISFI